MIDVNYPINGAAQNVITNYDIRGKNYNATMHIADQINNILSVIARIDKQEKFASLLYDAGYSDIAPALKLQGCTIKYFYTVLMVLMSKVIFYFHFVYLLQI